MSEGGGIRHEPVFLLPVVAFDFSGCRVQTWARFGSNSLNSAKFKCFTQTYKGLGALSILVFTAIHSSIQPINIYFAPSVCLSPSLPTIVGTWDGYEVVPGNWRSLQLSGDDKYMHPCFSKITALCGRGMDEVIYYFLLGWPTHPNFLRFS